MNVLQKKSVFVNAAFRTPMGKFGGSLKGFAAPQLAAELLRESIAKTQMNNPDFVIMGHGRQAGAGPNTARQAAIFAGLADSIPAWTINHACASGISAIAQGVDKILLGSARNLWVGGVESMSNTPYLVKSARWGQKLGHQKLVDAMYEDGFFCPMSHMVMGETVERFVASARDIPRTSQDAWAHQSHMRASAAWKNKHFDAETIPITFKGKILLQTDESVRADSSPEALAKLPPVFDENGSVTAGNSSGITDGSAWVWISDEKSPTSLCEILDYEIASHDPKLMGLAPVPSIKRLMQRNKLLMKDVESIEINEAFAAQVIACMEDLNIEPGKLNKRGGAIALGHPIGASGARIVTTLAHQLKTQKGALGIASLCVSGGQGFSMLLRGL